MADRATPSLSSVQLSRLNLAKALMTDPEPLLLDEPTASMDPDIAEKTRTMLKEVQKELGMTILYTSHNMREVEAMANRVLFLHRGKLVAEGTPKDLAKDFSEPDLEKVFIKIVRQK
jgi:ABC-2 type transport system ATP-binding protein